MPNFERLRSPFIPVEPLSRLAATITQNVMRLSILFDFSVSPCASHFCCCMAFRPQQFFQPHQTCSLAHFSWSVKRISLRIVIARVDPALSQYWSIINKTSKDPHPDILRRWQNRRRRANGTEANELRVARGGHLRRQPRKKCTSV